MLAMAQLGNADEASVDAAIGAAVGGAIGAVLGQQAGGRDAAIAGGSIGAAVGTAVATDGQSQHQHADHQRVIHVVQPGANGHPHTEHCPPGQAKKGRC